MKISTQFLTDYLLEKNLNWEAFDACSPMAAFKKEKLIADWRFGKTLGVEDVKKILKGFKGIHNHGEFIKEISFDDFLRAYQNKKKPKSN